MSGCTPSGQSPPHEHTHHLKAVFPIGARQALHSRSPRHAFLAASSSFVSIAFLRRGKGRVLQRLHVLFGVVGGFVDSTVPNTSGKMAGMEP